MSPFARDLLRTLPERRIGSQWFYDRRGSELFEAITALPEYYPTRTEIALLTEHAREMAEFLGADATLVEYGAGALTKVRILLAAMRSPRRFLPLDVSGEFVKSAAATLRDDFPDLAVEPIVASFLDPFPYPGGAVGFFPGSTVGNLTDGQIVALLSHARSMERFLLGIDLVKSGAVLEAAYDDAQGVTADFNLNLLRRANREADADFELDAWRHVALWNARDSRIEMHLESLRDQTVSVAGTMFAFKTGERILTEISRKFTPEILAPLLAESGWDIARSWIDAQMPYAVLGLARA